jgi:hypothetical protein
MEGIPEARELFSILNSRILVEHYAPELEELWNNMERKSGINLWSQLEKRDLSIVSDRLAIFSNICVYRRKINSIDVQKLSCGLSICLIALVILNGDFNPFSEPYTSPPYATKHDLPFWCSEIKPLLSMTAKEIVSRGTIPTTFLRNRLGRIPKLPEIKLSNQGVEMSG